MLPLAINGKPTMKNKELATVFALFYLGWFGCVLLAKTQFQLLSVVFPLLLILFLYFTKDLNKKSISFALVLSALGIFFDFILIQWGFVSMDETDSLPIPLWLICIWLLFSFSMIKLGPRFNPPLWLAATLGAVMGPLSYKSGEVFQVLIFSTPLTFLIYAVFWGAAFPLILRLSKRPL